jgi:hypothetical protein
MTRQIASIVNGRAVASGSADQIFRSTNPARTGDVVAEVRLGDAAVLWVLDQFTRW